MQETIRVRTSNRSGERIPDGKGLTIRLTTPNGKRYRADITSKEVGELVEWLKAEEMKPRAKKAGGSRRKKSATSRRKSGGRKPAASAPTPEPAPETPPNGDDANS